MKEKTVKWYTVVDDKDGRMIIDSEHADGAYRAYARKLEMISDGEGRKIDIIDEATLKRRAKKRIGNPGVIRRIPGRVSNPRRSKVKDALAFEALKHKEFEPFAKQYWDDCSRGILWYAVEKKDFSIKGDDIKKEAKNGKLYLSCNPAFALEENEDVPWIAEIDVRRVPLEKIKSKRGSLGACIKVLSTDKAEVLRVVSADKAKRAFRYQQGLLPSSKDQLFKFWEEAWNTFHRKEKQASEKLARIKARELRKLKKQKEKEERDIRREARARKKSSRRRKKKAAK